MFALAITGACLGFLLFNHHPAKVFMGDTGSLAIGGGVAALALLTHTELLLVILGGIYVMEATSVIMQVTYFRLTGGRRIFRMTPIHHHFELGGWKETKIVKRFFAASCLLCIAGVLLWYGLYGLRDSVTRRLLGGVWDGLTQQDLQMYEEAYLSNDADRESPYYCLFNNDLTREVPPCFIAGAEFDPLLDEFKLYPGTLHAFLHYSRMMKTADEALRDGAQFFTAQL